MSIGHLPRNTVIHFKIQIHLKSSHHPTLIPDQAESKLLKFLIWDKVHFLKALISFLQNHPNIVIEANLKRHNKKQLKEFQVLVRIILREIKETNWTTILYQVPSTKETLLILRQKSHKQKDNFSKLTPKSWSENLWEELNYSRKSPNKLKNHRWSHEKINKQRIILHNKNPLLPKLQAISTNQPSKELQSQMKHLI